MYSSLFKLPQKTSSRNIKVLHKTGIGHRLILFTLFIIAANILLYIPSSFAKENNNNSNSNNIPASITELVTYINAQNQQVVSLNATCETITKKSIITFSSVGNLYFEKSNKFHMTGFSKLDKSLVLDIGSDSNIFWVWSKRIKPVALYYGYFSDLDKIDIPISINPIVITDAIGLEGIVITGNTTAYYDTSVNSNNNITTTKIMILNAFVANNKKYIKAIQINPQTKRIDGYYIYSGDGKKSISYCKVVEYSSIVVNNNSNYNVDVPCLCKIRLVDENINISWRIYNIRLNDKIPQHIWQCPDYTPKTNLLENKNNPGIQLLQ